MNSRVACDEWGGNCLFMPPLEYCFTWALWLINCHLNLIMHLKLIKILILELIQVQFHSFEFDNSIARWLSIYRWITYERSTCECAAGIITHWRKSNSIEQRNIIYLFFSCIFQRRTLRSYGWLLPFEAFNKLSYVPVITGDENVISAIEISER